METSLATPNILGIVIGVTFIATLAALWLGFRFIGRAERNTRLGQLNRQPPAGQMNRQSVQPIFLEDAERARGTLANMRLFRWMRYRMEGAGMDWTVETFFSNILVCVGLGVFLGLLAPIAGARGVSMTLYALIGSTVPWIVVGYKHSKRMKALEAQLPEAVDFIARAIRAGHAFSVSLEMLSGEGPEPIRTEFRKVHTQVNLGGDLETAFKGLIARVPLLDIRFLVSAILLQRETGGNLSEILTNLGNIVRERMRLRGQVRAASAHGRMSALVLTAIPIIIAISLSRTAPDHLMFFFEHPVGRLLGIYMIASMITGYLVIRKLINFKI